MSKTALITGITGQDGSYLAELLTGSEPATPLRAISAISESSVEQRLRTGTVTATA